MTVAGLTEPSFTQLSSEYNAKSEAPVKPNFFKKSFLEIFCSNFIFLNFCSTVFYAQGSVLRPENKNIFNRQQKETIFVECK